MRKKLLFSFMLVCVALFVYHGAASAGITGKIAGVIKDAATGEPLPAVNVVIEGTTMGGATDDEGYYFIINIPPGTYSLEASMVGYAVESKTGVIVNVDHTTPADFNLRVTAIAGEEVTVTAEREIVPMDISASHIVADAEQITEVPLITDIGQYIHLQAGIEGDYIRGGGMDQTQFMVDGLMMVDNRANKPMMMVNLSAVRELNIIKGGFNPEYGNVRSGMINVITKEGSPSVYHGSIDFRLNKPHLKHGDVSIFDRNNYYLRPFLDPAVCMVGTDKGTWDEETQNSFPSFNGWNDYSEKLLSDSDPSNDMTPDEARDQFIWQHRAEGSDALIPSNYKDLTGREHHEGKYGNKPDWNMDVSFGGPIPSIGKYLGNLSFFASYRNNWEAFALPIAREYYKEQNASLKLTSRLSPSMKLTFDGLYGVINTTSQLQRRPSLNSYLTSGDAVFNTNLCTGGEYEIFAGGDMYFPDAFTYFDIFQSMQGLSFDHVLSPSTFYNVGVSHVRSKNWGPWIPNRRNTTTLRYFGSQPTDETPYGFYSLDGDKRMADGMIREGVGATNYDYSVVNTISFKGDLTSQVDRYNQIKVGFIFVYDDINTNYGSLSEWDFSDNRDIRWHVFPYRGGAYVQDKLEFEGMIANFGLRLDYNEPNTDWYVLDNYSKYFKREYKDVFTQVAPKEPAKGHLKISPRLGISHPISENAKLYFNYGHFYSMPRAEHMFNIDYGSPSGSINRIGNPSSDLPRTTSYELGVEYNVADIFLIHVSGYYKDVTDQTGYVRYQNYDGSVSTSTIENNNYADIRGFELRLDKRFGRWITGWLNYNYMVQTSGYFGRSVYYEDPRQQLLYGLQNPYQERPLARPVARANLNFRTPVGWGPAVAGIKPFGDILISSLLQWRAGRYETWDPLETYELQNNLQWKSSYNFDARLSKRVRYGRYSIELFADVKNLLNLKYLASQGFADSTDELHYLESLHLPMYRGTAGATEEEYRAAGFISGDDKPGDLRSNDKPYIDNPNRKFLTNLNSRSIFFGLKINF